MLFNQDFAPPRGFSAEVAAGYSTLQRQLSSGSSLVDDRSDVTGKFTLIGMRWTRLPEGDLGAGTPASEVRFRDTFPTSHDEGSQARHSPIQLVATGNGRYENFLGVVRKSVGAADSIELGFEQRRHKITDLLNFEGSALAFTHERDLIAERLDFGIGWRHRLKNFEAALAFAGARIEAKNDTPPSGILVGRTLYGGQLELRGRRGPWSASLAAQAIGGNLNSSDRYGATSFQTVYRRPAWLTAATLSLARRFGRLDVLLSGTVDRSRLPGVALAVSGSEQLAFNKGYHADSRTRQWFVDLALRHEIVPGVFPRFYFRYAHGSETVALSDAAGVLPARTLEFLRGGQFPPVGANPSAPEYSIGITVEATLGRR